MFGFVRRALRKVIGPPAPMRVLGDNVLVRRARAATETEGGVLLPENLSGKPCEGEVVAVGPGRQIAPGVVVPPSVRRGDWVFFGRMAGTEVVLDGEDYLVIRDEELLAVLG